MSHIQRWTWRIRNRISGSMDLRMKNDRGFRILSIPVLSIHFGFSPKETVTIPGGHSGRMREREMSDGGSIIGSHQALSKDLSKKLKFTRMFSVATTVR